ncbi:hypothetical protein A2U01_0114607 [Trifolium medium]|uniref:Uncharacterized protein n=1 Tax=Trifolium medium TaxID=97028 RepID=A0A392W0N2_9FABA|nr:hypothetical protein [Trifolium medium]
MLCMRSPGEDLKSPGDVLGCRRARSGDGVARSCQWVANFPLLGR